MRDVIARIKHAQSRPLDAFQRIIRRGLLHLAGIDLSLETELQYLQSGNFLTKVLSKTQISENQLISFGIGQNEYHHSFTPRFTIEITDVIVNTSTNHIYAIKENSKRLYLLKESTVWPTHLEIINSRVPNGKPKLVIEEATLGIPKTGFYHWVTEDLPRMLHINKDVEVLVYKDTANVVAELIKSLKRNTRVVEKWVYVKKLTFVTKGQDLGYIHPEDAKHLRQALGSVQLNQDLCFERIYVSRRKSRRALPNENLIEEYLMSKNFQIIYAEDFSMIEQIHIFQNAKLIVGVHGAGLTNAIWSLDSKLIEIMPKERINRCFEWQSRICAQKYEVVYYSVDNFSIEELKTTLEALIS